MPLPLKTNDDSKPPVRKGPPPVCECSQCPICRNRERQRRFREKNLLREKLGFEQEPEDEDSEETDD
jgi:hypothetical protein